jgi:hypothetical protein
LIAADAEPAYITAIAMMLQPLSGHLIASDPHLTTRYCGFDILEMVRF